MAIVNSYSGGMAAPERTSLTEIVAAARTLLEAGGPAGVTMQAVAERVGVRPPSLYKRVRDREELLRLVAEESLAELAARLDAAVDLGDLANRYRSFGRECPEAFRLVITPGSIGASFDPTATRAASEAVLRLVRERVGETRSLEAARTLTAWATGFLVMELGGGFRLGGDIERAWRSGFEAMTEAVFLGQDPGETPHGATSGKA